MKPPPSEGKKPETHPAPEALKAFRLGKLKGAEAASVAGHLHSCQSCRLALKVPDDSFSDQALSTRVTLAPDLQQPDHGEFETVTPGACSGEPSVEANLENSALPMIDELSDLPAELAQHARLRIIRELGRGGMGAVYLAEHRLMERQVAVKVINKAQLDRPDALPRFLSEIKAAARLNHENIVRAYDAEEAGALHMLVMEYVEGISLDRLVQKKGSLPVAHACHYIRQAALGLQYASEQGMTHRDIKPQNLMLTPQGKIKILDFGLARMRSERTTHTGLTQEGAFMGTPQYVAPEQATDARHADVRADIYSLGCTLYFLLTGRPPFQEDSVIKLVLAHLEKEPRPIHELRPDMPTELSAVVARMLAKDPAGRFQKPADLAQALLPFSKPGLKPVTPRHHPRQTLNHRERAKGRLGERVKER